ncbi:sulfite exporter TauE/SafE family protein [Saccharospirillum alexandrii]|uniref:urease accessory protein UreH domain-containing protein n=1 Tax=Saccharospirillum alexandrii TaxID=2448477 RepID=UPI003734E8EA
MADWWRGMSRIEALGRCIWRLVEPLGRRLVPVTNTYRAIALGSIWGAIMWSGSHYVRLNHGGCRASNCSRIDGAFGLGTLPTVLGTGIAAQR